MSPRILIIIVCSIGLYFLSRYLFSDHLTASSNEEERIDKRKKVVFQQKNGLDAVLLALGYKKKVFHHTPHEYIQKVIRRKQNGEIVEYYHEDLQKRIQLFFDYTFGENGVLKKIFLFQPSPEPSSLPSFIDFSWIQRDLDIFFDNTSNLSNVTPSQILKVLDEANQFYANDSRYPSQDHFDKIKASSSSRYLKDNFGFLVSDNGFKKVYDSNDHPAYFQTFFKIQVFTKNEIEIIVGYYLYKDESELTIILSDKGQEIKRIHGGYLTAEVETAYSDFIDFMDTYLD